jgi:23S rRNA pseudouridine1911/1915/1917 synthase
MRHGQENPRNGPSSRGNRHSVIFVYEDDDLIVVEKPVGLPVIAPEGSRSICLLDIVSAHIQKKNPKGRAAVVHRLDRDSSGIMVFARHARAKKVIMENWNELVFERKYSAVVEGCPDSRDGVFDSWLVENKAGHVYIGRKEEHGALRAITHWKLETSSARYSLLSLTLETGRKHQIRVQTSASGHPIAGDARYGARSDPLRRLCLHASILGLDQPFTHERFSFESPAPEGFIALTANAHGKH